MLVANLASCVVLSAISCLGICSLASAACTAPGSPFHLYKSHGSLQSPGYPSHYYGGEQCHWHLNPPRNSLADVIILDIELETNVDGVPDAAHVCYTASNYVELGGVAKGCGKEGPLCLAFMLMSRTDLKCHQMIKNHFPNCQTLVHRAWPLTVSFVTSQPDNKSGFNMNYTFYDCDVSPVLTTVPPEITDSEKTKTESSTSNNSTEAIITNAIVPEESKKKSNPYTTTSTATSKTTTTTTTTTTTSTATNTKSSFTLGKKTPYKKAVKTVATKPGTVSSTLAPTTLKIIKETVESAPRKSNRVLIIVFVSLCVLFIFIIIAVIFRNRLQTWLTKKPPVRSNDSPNNNNGVRQTDPSVVPIDEKSTHEQPIPITSNPPPIPSPNLNGNNYMNTEITLNNYATLDYGHTNTEYTVDNKEGNVENHIYSSIQA